MAAAIGQRSLRRVVSTLPFRMEGAMRFPTIARRVRIVIAVTALGLRAGCTFAQAITEFPIPTPGGSPVGIVTGPDGNLWFTELFSGKIGRLSADGGPREFRVPTQGAWLWSITAGPDGNLWFTEASVSGDVGTGKIGRITPLGVVTEFPTPSLLSAPQFITAGPDGNLWFTDTETSHIGKVTTDGVITAFPVAMNSTAAGDHRRSRRKSLVYRDQRQQDRSHDPCR